MITRKNIALTRQTFVSKVMSLVFEMLFRFVIALLTRSKCLLISWLQSPSVVIWKPKKIKSVTVSTFSPSICNEVMGPKSLPMRVKEEREKVGLKLSIQKTKIMASGPITSWEIIDGETVETVSGFIFGGSKITADGDCSHEIKRRLLLGRKVMTKLESIFKSRDITLPTKVRLVKAMVFPVVMYGRESWTVKKAEHRRIDAFELRCWRRLL